MGEYETWEGRFAVPEYVFGTAPNGFLAAQKHRLPARGKALAFADGEGRNGVWLAEQGLDVLSLDRSPTAQMKAQALAAARGVTIRTELADVARWPFPDAAFDVIAVIFTQFATPAERAVQFAGFHRALKPGGLLLMQGYRPEQLAYGTGGPKQAGHMYTRALIEAAFAGFAELHIEEHDSEMAEGMAHGGMAALIDLVGRK